MNYKIHLEKFEGPLDLLLYLIKKNDIDICDIPIAIITDQYMEYIEMMKCWIWMWWGIFWSWRQL